MIERLRALLETEQKSKLLQLGSGICIDYVSYRVVQTEYAQLTNILRTIDDLVQQDEDFDLGE